MEREGLCAARRTLQRGSAADRGYSRDEASAALASIAGAADCLSLAFAPVLAPERIAAPAAFGIAASLRLREHAEETLPGFGGLGVPMLVSSALGLGIQMHATR
jgi:hypothetical protein